MPAIPIAGMASVQTASSAAASAHQTPAGSLSPEANPEATASGSPAICENCEAPCLWQDGSRLSSAAASRRSSLSYHGAKTATPDGTPR
jgi:hypothetical protein